MLTKDVFKSWETGQKAPGVAWGVFLEHVMRFAVSVLASIVTYVNSVILDSDASLM
jgi:hypothetical protein